MPQNLFSKRLIISFSLVILALAPVAQATTYSAATAKRWLALTLSGNLLLLTGPVPVGAVIRAELHLDGTVTGREAGNVGGQHADETTTGTFTGNGDCNGAAMVSSYEDGQLVRTSMLALIFNDNSKQVRMVQKSLLLPDGTSLPVTVLI